MIILGIETSCDETAISVVRANGDLKDPKFEILGSAIHSQIEMHTEYGGVVPNLAKREHLKNLPIVYKQALKNAKIEEKDIELIAVTVGPGLEPALWTGIKFAEELRDKLNVKIIPTNHMIGHIASVLFSNEKVEFPAIALLVSGNHTELIVLNSWQNKKKIGESKDDAVGEAFDKVARLLDLPYPGGPQISKLAIEAREKNVHLEIRFPRPMIHSKDFDFSFSGLKTAVLYYLKSISTTPSLLKGKKQGEGVFPLSKKMEVAREFEDAVIEVLVHKTKKAIEEFRPKTLIIGGGVIANTALREVFLNFNQVYPDLSILIPEKSLTTDNATMIAAAGYIEYLRVGTKKAAQLVADGNLSIE